LDFRVGPRYAVQDRVGCGAHGEVVSACDSSGAVFAIKRLESRFDSRSLPFDFGAAKRALREVRLLRCLGHPNIVELLDIVAPPPEDAAEDAVVEGAVLEDEGAPPRRFSQVYLVTTLASTDLDRVLEAARGPGFALKPEQSVYLSYQLLCAVSHLASAGLLHRDVKPANLLIDLKTCQLRLCDFGLARAVPKHAIIERGAFALEPIEASTRATMTQYVVTRWYRAPEVLCGDAYYGAGIDVWSTGCVFFELLAPKAGALFRGGERREMLGCINAVLGRPTEDDLWFVDNEHASAFVRALPLQATSTLQDRLETADASEDAVDLLSKMIQFDPRKRIGAAEALRHAALSWPRLRVGIQGARALEAAADVVDMDDIEAASSPEAMRRILRLEVERFEKRD